MGALTKIETAANDGKDTAKENVNTNDNHDLEIVNIKFESGFLSSSEKSKSKSYD